MYKFQFSVISFQVFGFWATLPHYIYHLFLLRYFLGNNAVFYHTTVGFSGLAVCLLNLMLYIIDVLVENKWGASCMRGYWNDGNMVYCLWYLTKVGMCFEDGGLLVPTIFRCAVGEGLGYVIIIFTLFTAL